MGRGKWILLQCRVLPFVIIFVALLVLAIAGVRRSRARAVARIRACWGQPIDRERKLDAITESHRSRLSNIGTGAGLDDRTWEDLNLDEVFAALDRTESTLGQHALYHRLRTAPVADHLQAFDALVNRFGTDAPLRERAQIALARLQDPHGYDLWWLARPDAIDVRPWYVLFPVLTVATMALAGLALFWPQACPGAHRRLRRQRGGALSDRFSHRRNGASVSTACSGDRVRSVSAVSRGRRCAAARRRRFEQTGRVWAV